MPTNILRKLDIAVERKVVAAQSRTTTAEQRAWEVQLPRRLQQRENAE